MIISASFVRQAAWLILGNALLAIGILAVFCIPCFRENLVYSFTYSFLLCILLGWGNGYLTNKISTRISWVETPLKRLLVGVLACIGYSLVASIFVVIVMNVASSRLNLFALNWAAVIQAAVFPVYIAMGMTAFLTSRSFLLSWRQAAIDMEKLKREHLQAQYDALKNQVNPHFLFNSFNVLSDLVYVNPDVAVQFIQQLSRIFRYVLESSQRELVPLRTELEFLRAYVFLLTIRFGDSLRVSLPEIVPENCQMVPLSLQMLVENAVKHNVISADEPLTVKVTITDGYIQVANNVQRRNFVEHSTRMGLHNIQARYVQVSKKPVAITEANGQFEVNLPLVVMSDLFPASSQQFSPKLPIRPTFHR